MTGSEHALSEEEHHSQCNTSGGGMDEQTYLHALPAPNGVYVLTLIHPFT